MILETNTKLVYALGAASTDVDLVGKYKLPPEKVKLPPDVMISLVPRMDPAMRTAELAGGKLPFAHV